MGFVFQEEQKRVIFSQAHHAIDFGYDLAIAHFQQQKELFQKQLNITNEDTLKSLIEQINQQVYVEAEKQIDAKAEDILTSLGPIIVEEFDKYLADGNFNAGNIIKKIDNYKGRRKGTTDPHTQIDYLSRVLRDQINSFFQNEFIQNQLSKYQIYSKDSSLMNNLLGYARKTIINKYLFNEKSYDITNYKNSLRGYLQENALEEAITKVFKPYQMGGKVAGSFSDENNLQIIYDIVLGTNISKNTDDKQLEAIINRIDNIQGVVAEGNSSIPEFYGGVQSKSWNNPFNEKTDVSKLNALSLKFGKHAGLIPTGMEAYYWHAGVRNLMNNILDVLGPANFLFATGTDISFTVDLLQQFRNANYVLNFYKPINNPIHDSSVYMSVHADN